MTSGELKKNNWFYMKYIGKYLGVEILMTCECSIQITISWYLILVEQTVINGNSIADMTENTIETKLFPVVFWAVVLDILTLKDKHNISTLLVKISFI